MSGGENLVFPLGIRPHTITAPLSPGQHAPQVSPLSAPDSLLNLRHILVSFGPIRKPFPFGDSMGKKKTSNKKSKKRKIRQYEHAAIPV